MLKRTGWSWRKVTPVAACVVLLLATCGPLAGCGLGPRTRVLFIGNSYTSFNGGLDQQLARMDRSIEAASVAPGGYRLEDHWNDPKTLSALQGGKWDYVVLQEQSQTPVVDQAKFDEYAGRFDAEIRKGGAETVLLMTWERPDSVVYGVTTQNVGNAYHYLGAQLGVKVAPAGLAFALALQEQPDLALYSQDGHPTVEGTYLAACVLYGTLLGKSPLGLSYSPGLSEQEKRILQGIAAKTLGY